MTTQRRDALVDAYLGQLRRAARGLPKVRRDELASQLEEHLREALPPDATEAATRVELDRLGPPARIVAEEYGRLASPPVVGGRFEWIAIALLLIGGLILPVVGWLIGVFMLWSSRVWSRREKLVGTLLVPGGLGGVVLLGLFALGSSGGACITGPGQRAVTHCTGASGTSVLGIVLTVVLAVAAISTTTYLARRISPPVGWPA